jgi:hypothetical protein
MVDASRHVLSVDVIESPLFDIFSEAHATFVRVRILICLHVGMSMATTWTWSETKCHSTVAILQCTKSGAVPVRAFAAAWESR